MTVYIALLRKDRTSDYGVDFPGFPWCVTAGSTVEEAASDSYAKRHGMSRSGFLVAAARQAMS